MDSFGSFRSVARNIRPLTKREIEKMKKIMRRVPILKQKNDEYHKKEEQEADTFFDQQLKKID